LRGCTFAEDVNSPADSQRAWIRWTNIVGFQLKDYCEHVISGFLEIDFSEYTPVAMPPSRGYIYLKAW